MVSRRSLTVAGFGPNNPYRALPITKVKGDGLWSAARTARDEIAGSLEPRELYVN